MSTYAIGDIQGCYVSLQRLLARLRFDPARDRLWLAGDLVNRGPKNLEVLRWAKAHEHAITAVLGNHDVHLLARGFGVGRRGRRDTLADVLAAPDRDELLDWLRRRPLLVREGERLLLHAGLLPGWTAEEAEARARRAEDLLRGPEVVDLLKRLGGHGSAEQALVEAARDIAVFTRVRMLDAQGEPRFDYDGPPESAPQELIPWYAAPGRQTTSCTVVFGHWAALGLRLLPGVIATDSGCVWGNVLSAVRLEDHAVYQEPRAD